VRSIVRSDARAKHVKQKAKILSEKTKQGRNADKKLPAYSRDAATDETNGAPQCN